MWFVGCAAPGCHESTDGFTALDELGKTWFNDPSTLGETGGHRKWLCLEHKDIRKAETPSPKVEWSQKPNSVWVGETWPDPEVLTEVAKNMTDDERSAFGTAGRPAQPSEFGKAVGWSGVREGFRVVSGGGKNSMRPRTGKPKFESLPDPDESEISAAMDIMGTESHPELSKQLDEVFEAVGKQLQDDFGFTRPEEGSQERYERRKTKVPWLDHTAWWYVHNAIAHPLIGILPVRWAFQFHDWTSRKMHGK